MPLFARRGKSCPHGECISALTITALIEGFSSQNGKSMDEVEKAVLEEFGRCMKQIISSAQSGR